MFKSMQPVMLFDMFLNPSFKMMIRFANIVTTTSEFTYEERFQIIRNWVFI